VRTHGSEHLRLALILTFSPWEKELHLLGSGFADTCSANSVVQNYKVTADHSPSPGGEGRGEDEPKQLDS
jgi:hypothetical protein